MNCPLCEELANLPKTNSEHIEKDKVKEGEHECSNCGRHVCENHSVLQTGGKTVLCLDCIA